MCGIIPLSEPSDGFEAGLDLVGAIACRRDGRVVEGAPLLRAYGSKAHRGFESLSLRQLQTQLARRDSNDGDGSNS